MDRAPSDLRKGDATRGLARGLIACFRALQGKIAAPAIRPFSLADAVDALAALATGHVRGKISVTVV